MPRIVRVIAIILCLPAAATTDCPADWTRSPVSSTCFFVPPDRSTSFSGCVGLCKKHGDTHGGTPACIGSEAENDFVTQELSAAMDALWLGLYQNETGLGPTKGWDRCVSGDAPNFTNWRGSEPNDHAGLQEDCAILVAPDLFGAGNGQWLDTACGDSRSVYGASAPSHSCLCARGHASVTFADDLKALEATSAYSQWLLGRRTARAFAAATALALLPALLLLGRAGWRRLRRGVGAEPSAGVQAATSPSRSTTALSSTPSGAASSAAARGKLRAARESAVGRRLRVSFAMGLAGWALSVIGLTPTAIMSAEGVSIDAAGGGSDYWGPVLARLGGCLLLLALFPIDARAIRVVCATLLVVCTGFGALSIAGPATRDLPDEYVIPLAALDFATAAALAPTLRCRGDRAMQPRPALRRLWIVIRLRLLGGCVFHSAFSIAIYVQGNSRVVDRWAVAAWSVADFLLAAIATPRNRGRLHRRLGRLGGRGTEAEEAAAVAALVGGSDPDAALERASKLLRCLPASRLHAADLDDNMTTAPPAGPTLHARTEPAAMGEVTAFLSHSWSDEREAPGAKHAVVSRWANQRQETTGIEPTLWLVALAHIRCTPLPTPRMHAR